MDTPAAKSATTPESTPGRPHRPPVIGLAGGIGAGKSEVARALAELGCVVSSSDALGAAALQDPSIASTLRQWWGDTVFGPPGPDGCAHPDRRRIAARIFDSPAERARLEALLHPWIARERHRIFDAAPPGTPALVIDAPLLFEVGLDRECDAVVFVDAPLQTRQERVQAHRNWGPDELSRREAAQWPLDLKRQKADHVISNDARSDALRAQVRQVLGAVLEAHRATDR